MITFTDSAIKYLKAKVPQGKFYLKLTRGGCSGAYFDLHVLKPDQTDLVKLASTDYEVFTEMMHARFVSSGDMKINYVEEYGEGFLTVDIESAGLSTCMCKKSFFNEETYQMDLPFESDGLVGSMCQPIEY